ncbi:MAG: 2OG-Fe(II) oxygenase [Halioglobus sp.]
MSAASVDNMCSCGSGKSYDACCEARDALRWNEEAFGRIQGNFLSPEFARYVANEPVCELDGVRYPPGILARRLDDDYDLPAIADRIRAIPDAREAAVNVEGESSKLISSRVTGIVNQGDMTETIIALVQRAYAWEVEPFYRCKLRSLESPQILRYTEGSHYRPHADSDVLDQHTQKWKKSQDRDYSLLIYLDQDFEGGELVFPNFDFTLRPQAGMLVAFPSDFRYLHGAKPVLSGVRHAIVSWCAIKPRSPQ